MMTVTDTALPKVVSRVEWLAARKALLAKEKAPTRHRDAPNAERRRLPMVRVDEEYVFDGPAGKASLVIGTFNYLDLTSLGRQEDWEEPSGRSDGPFMHWVRRHDRYDAEVAAPDAASPGTDSCCGSAAHRAYSSPEGEMP